MIVSTEGTSSDGVTAITVVGGVDPLLEANGGQSVTLPPWSLGGGGMPAETHLRHVSCRGKVNRAMDADRARKSEISKGLGGKVRFIFSGTRNIVGFLALAVLLCANFATARTAAAQASPAQSGSAILRGSVTDPSGAAVPDATIQVTNSAGQTVNATSSRDGAYEVRGLAAGKYSLRVASNGFEPFVNADVEIAAGQVKSIDAPLVIQVQQQKVEVTSAGGAGSSGRGSREQCWRDRLKGSDLDALSDDPDELQADLEALAGPSLGPNGGQMYIDGFTAGRSRRSLRFARYESIRIRFPLNMTRSALGALRFLPSPARIQLHGSGFVMGNTKGSQY